MHKILIIEDEQILRRQIARLLQLEGFETLEAPDGAAGVAIATNTLPDLIICDIMMPGMDGFGVLQSLRNNPRMAMIPFIFLTALVSNQDQRHGMEEGADDYITKPYKPAALIGSVRRRLEKRGRQLAENRQRADEVSLAVAASLPKEILETLEHITTVTSLLALKYSAQDPQVAAMHEAVTQESARLRRLTRRLHLYAELPRLYANRFELAKGELPTAAAAVMELAAREICRNWKREADLVIQAEPVALPIREEYLVLIMQELVDNACKFSEAGTPVILNGRLQKAFWALTVHNLGPGMTADQVNHIAAFKQFLTGSKKPPGLGLGLALTQGIARLYGSEFDIKSDPEGTTVTVMVPLEN